MKKQRDKRFMKRDEEGTVGVSMGRRSSRTEGVKGIKVRGKVFGMSRESF